MNPPQTNDAEEPPPFSRHTRDQRVANLAGQRFDVLVIGGGITGAAIARDASLRGLRVCLLDKNDLGAGTSSASSKLIHGGLRYLPRGHLGLVWESVTERARLRDLAPHLVRPLPFFFPVYRRRPKPLWVVAFGVFLYELLALFRVPARHRTLRAAEALDAFPGLRSDGLDGGVVFWDCATDDARLTLETAQSAHEAGAWVLPRLTVLEFLSERSQVAGVRARDERGGLVHEVRASIVVNATGPWTDRTLGLRRSRARLLRPTKGSHIVLSSARLPLGATLTMSDPRDDRTVFAIPSDSCVLVGTTDTDYDGDYDDVRVTGPEVASFLRALNHAFPDARLGPEDVLGSWAGLRPLLAVDALEATAIPREHVVHDDEDGLISVAGGKLTTHRLMAEQVVDRIAVRLRAEGMHVGRCPTASIPLPGGVGIEADGEELRTTAGAGERADAEAEARLGPEVAAHLRRTYGGRWLEVTSRAGEDERLGQRIDPTLPYIWAEVDHAVEEQMAMTLLDVMRRRTQLALRSPDQGLGVAPAVARRMGELLGWSAAAVQGQVAGYHTEIAAQNRWRQELGDDAAADGLADEER